MSVMSIPAPPPPPPPPSSDISTTITRPTIPPPAATPFPPRPPMPTPAARRSSRFLLSPDPVRRNLTTRCAYAATLREPPRGPDRAPVWSALDVAAGAHEQHDLGGEPVLRPRPPPDRNAVVEGTSVSARFNLGRSRI